DNSGCMPVSKFRSDQKFHSNVLGIISTDSTGFGLVILVFIVGSFLTLSFGVKSEYVDFWLLSFSLALAFTAVLGLRIYLGGKSDRKLFFKHYLLWFGFILLTLTLFYISGWEDKFLFLFSASLFSFFFFMGFGLFVFASEGSRYSIDLQTEELVIESYSTILGWLGTQRVRRGAIESVIITTAIAKDRQKKDTDVLIIKTSEREFRIPTFEGRIGLTRLTLVALYLLKYFRIPITFEKLDKVFTPEIFQHRENLIRAWGKTRLLETSLAQIGWIKIKDNPLVIQEQYRLNGKILLILHIIFAWIFLKWYFEWLIPLMPILLKRSWDFQETVVGILTIVIFFVFIGVFLILFGLSMKDVVRLDEKGVYAGHRLGVIRWNTLAFLPYECIRRLEIEKVEPERVRSSDRPVRDLFKVSIDFFLGSEELGKFKSKEEAEQFRDYISHMCSSYQRL
ncbi:MAG: hypothetical protein ACFFBD_17470, partial [Candidatus Hodarchaeota archaeon]